jgi:hypothetical protein
MQNKKVWASVDFYDPGIYSLNFPEFATGLVASEDGKCIRVNSGVELEIQYVRVCKKSNFCEAGYWCPGRFKVVKPFQGLFCLVLYTRSNPGGCLSLSLIRSLKWKDGKLLRRMNLNTE